MIVYFHTSALLPIFIKEPFSYLCRRLWDDADHRVTCSGAYVEVAAALALAVDRGRLTLEEHERVWANFARMWSSLYVISMGRQLLQSAAEFAQQMELDGAAAVHCAAVAALCGPEVVAASGEDRLVRAWGELGVHTVHTRAPRRRVPPLQGHHLERPEPL